MLQRTANLEILREVVLPVEAEHALALHTVFRIRFQRHVDVRTCIDDALVQDGHLAGRVVDAIVGTLRQYHATSRHHHRTLRHVIGTQRDDIGRCALELAHQHELVLVRHLTGSSTGGVIELFEGVFGNAVLRQSALLQEVVECLAKGLSRGEEHASVADGIALHIVEIAVGIHAVVIVQTVTAQSTQQGGILRPRVRDIAQVDACRIALVLDVQTETGALNAGCQVVDVLHHQVPVGLVRTVARILQRLDDERLLRIVRLVGSKLTHTEGLSIISELIGHRQHLVSLQRSLQRDIAKGRIQRIFRRGEQAGC